MILQNHISCDSNDNNNSECTITAVPVIVLAGLYLDMPSTFTFTCFLSPHLLQAFGVGALEDGEEEEDNVYGEETLTSYHSTLADDQADNTETTYGWTGKIQSGKSVLLLLLLLLLLVVVVVVLLLLLLIVVSL